MKDGLAALLDVLLDVDDPARGEELASRAYLSRFHFDRLVAAALGETPAAFRRRLLLERAAYSLSGGAGVLEAALAAGYGSAESFARAFRRAFGVTPSAHHGEFRLAAPNGIHFHPPGGVLVPGDERRQTMDLTERLVAHDNWLAARLIDAATALDDDVLNEPIPLNPPTPAFASEKPSIRCMLNRLVFTKEMWSAAISGQAFVESDVTSLEGMLARLEAAGGEFASLVRDIASRKAWDTAFVDATCEPPGTFTYGGAVAHVLTWNAQRRQIVSAALGARGIEVSTDPIAWERSAG
jgi:AraC family transcriptional regulator